MSLKDQSVSLQWVRSSSELRAALALRLRVFCDEQGVPREAEVDAYDDVARHAVAVAADGTVVGTMRLIPSGTMVKVGRVAVDREWRGRGIASDLLDRAMEYAQGIRAEELRLAAQVVAADLYRKAGYRQVGRPFEEEGIEHVWMVREVVPPRRGRSLLRRAAAPLLGNPPSRDGDPARDGDGDRDAPGDAP